MIRPLRLLCFVILLGVGVGLAGTLMIFHYDIGNLGTLMRASDAKWLAAVIFLFQMAVTGAMATVAIAVMGFAGRFSESEPDDAPRGPSLRQQHGTLQLKPVPVRASKAGSIRPS